ncbi:MAG: hypothetical protein R3B46_05065 [Phycisphaerales bacterium]
MHVVWGTDLDEIRFPVDEADQSEQITRREGFTRVEEKQDQDGSGKSQTAEGSDSLSTPKQDTTQSPTSQEATAEQKKGIRLLLRPDLNTFWIEAARFLCATILT